MKLFSKAPFPQENKWAESFLQFPKPEHCPNLQFLTKHTAKNKRQKKSTAPPLISNKYDDNNRTRKIMIEINAIIIMLITNAMKTMIQKYKVKEKTARKEKRQYLNENGTIHRRQLFKRRVSQIGFELRSVCLAALLLTSRPDWST